MKNRGSVLIFIAFNLLLMYLAIGVMVPRALRRCSQRAVGYIADCPRYGHGCGYGEVL